MREKNSIIFSFYFLLSVVALFFVSAYFTPVKEVFSSVFLPFPVFQTHFAEIVTGDNLISSAIALIFLTAIAVSLYYINDSFFLMANESRILPLIYLILALSNPSAVFFSKYHIMAFLLLWAFYFNVRYTVEEEKKINSLFLAFLLFSTASLFFPVLIWIPVVLFFTDIIYSKEYFFKYLIVFVAAMAIPYIYFFSIRYIFFDAQVAEFFSVYGKIVSDFNIDFSNSYKISYLFMLGVIAVVSLRSLFFILKRRSSYNVASARAFNQGVIFLSILLLLGLLYSSSMHSLYQLVVYIPISLMIFAFINHKDSKSHAKAFIILMILSIAICRISYFI
jgi:hypothetical protein